MAERLLPPSAVIFAFRVQNIFLESDGEYKLLGSCVSSPVIEAMEDEFIILCTSPNLTPARFKGFPFALHLHFLIDFNTELSLDKRT